MNMNYRTKHKESQIKPLTRSLIPTVTTYLFTGARQLAAPGPTNARLHVMSEHRLQPACLDGTPRPALPAGPIGNMGKLLNFAKFQFPCL